MESNEGFIELKKRTTVVRLSETHDARIHVYPNCACTYMYNEYQSNQIFIENHLLKTSQMYLNYKYKLKFTIET